MGQDSEGPADMKAESDAMADAEDFEKCLQIDGKKINENCGEFLKKRWNFLSSERSANSLKKTQKCSKNFPRKANSSNTPADP